jgi:hypothetical protein
LAKIATWGGRYKKDQDIEKMTGDDRSLLRTEMD